MHTTPSKYQFQNYRNDWDVMRTIARHEIKGMNASKVDPICAERSRTEFQTQIKDSLVDMLQHGSIAQSNKVRTASIRFLKRIKIELFSHVLAEGFRSNCLQKWSKNGTFMGAIITQNAFRSFFMQHVSVFVKQHVDSTNDEYRLTQVYAWTEKTDITGKLLPPSTLL